MKIETYKSVKAVIEKIITETSNIKTFVLNPEEKIQFKTGRFVEITVPGIGEAPFTPSSSPYVSEKIDMTIMKAGLVTDALHSMKEGEVVGVRGPYGKGYPVDEFRGKRVAVIGGGVGLAPLRSLLYELMHDLSRFEKVSLYYGAKTPADIMYKDFVKELEDNKELDVHLTVDNADKSWGGNVGVVTTILKDLKPKGSVACVCGPPIMMKFATLKLLELGFKEEDIYLSMEKNMSCGIGKCGHCRIGYLYACKDGPVFKYSQIKGFDGIWD